MGPNKYDVVFVKLTKSQEFRVQSFRCLRCCRCGWIWDLHLHMFMIHRLQAHNVNNA